MAERPQVKPGEWIKAANQDCLVTEAFGDESSDGQCEVIFDADTPRRGKATWNGEEWVLPATGFSGYAEKQPDMEMYVRRLKEGPSD